MYHDICSSFLVPCVLEGLPQAWKWLSRSRSAHENLRAARAIDSYAHLAYWFDVFDEKRFQKAETDSDSYFALLAPMAFGAGAALSLLRCYHSFEKDALPPYFPRLFPSFERVFENVREELHSEINAADASQKMFFLSLKNAYAERISAVTKIYPHLKKDVDKSMKAILDSCFGSFYHNPPSS